MNYIDTNFTWLCNEIRGKTKEEVFQHIKEKYLALPKDIKNSIETFLKEYPYWGTLEEEKGEYEELENKAISLWEHIDDYRWLYEMLGDYRSKKLLFAILYNWYDYNFSVLKTLIDPTYCHYFDLDILPCKEEVFVDVGAYTGDTTLDFIHSYGKSSYKRIYCYEMTPSTCEMLLKNTENYPNIIVKNFAVWDKLETLYINPNETSSSANTLSDTGEAIKAVSLDEDIKEPITLIKMDIEGAEYRALQGAKEHIQEDHPKLLISVYHNHEDLWKIPKMIEEICPGYAFYLRYYGGPIFPTEIVLFGIYAKK